MHASQPQQLACTSTVPTNDDASACNVVLHPAHLAIHSIFGVVFYRGFRVAVTPQNVEGGVVALQSQVTIYIHPLIVKHNKQGWLAAGE